MGNYPESLLGLVEELKAVTLRAYDMGHAVGVAQGEANLRKELASILNRNSPPSAPVQTKAVPPAVSETGPRAPKGSVRPAILSTLEGTGHALTPNEILLGVHSLGQTLIKAETVRTTLHKMYAEGRLMRSGDRWSLKRTEGSEAVAAEPS
jgi:hypothetical protein